MAEGPAILWRPSPRLSLWIVSEIAELHVHEQHRKQAHKITGLIN